MSDVAIRVEGLGKQYRIGAHQEAYGTLRDAITGAAAAPFRWLRRRGADPSNEAFWALKDVSFTVHHGEVLGVIGRNGAGKSTLLKILSHITQPTEGKITIQGRIGSLLEVGTGFHPELTGRENIFLNGAILGMKQAEVQRKFDEIVEFAEIEKFIDTPVKRYSSGMYMRLAFAVAAHLEPEILLVDEVLAVGDMNFQQKSIRKMGSVARAGRSVLVVSHNLRVVETLADRCVYLKNGSLVTEGPTPDVIKQYQRESLGGTLTDDLPAEFDIQIDHPKVKISGFTLIHGTTGQEINIFDPGAPLRLSFDVEALTNVPDAVVCLRIYRERVTVSGNNSDHTLGKLALRQGERRRFQIDIEALWLIPNNYTIVIFVLPSYFARIADAISNFCNVELVTQGSRTYGGGYVYLPQKWSVSQRNVL